MKAIASGRARAGLSGTSAGFLAEGPLGTRGSWLVSARRSYLDWLLGVIDAADGVAFGFSDVEAKLVFDAGAKHQLQLLAIGGVSKFTETPDELARNDEAVVGGRSWLGGVTWRYTPSSRLAVTQRLWTTGLAHTNRNRFDEDLDRHLSAEAAWRSDAQFDLRRGVRVEFGADAQSLRGRHARSRAVNDAGVLSTISDYRATSWAGSGYAQAVFDPTARFGVTAGSRLDHWAATGTTTGSPWLTARIGLAARTRMTLGAGVHRQFPDLDQIHGQHRSRSALRPQTARHLDAGISHRVGTDVEIQATWFAREERDLLWTPGGEPRLDERGVVVTGRGDAPWVNALTGSARGVEVVVRRDAPAGLTGWIGYGYGTHRLDSPSTGETFAADFDQRHTVTMFAHYRFGSRTSVGAKFRYGSNYPIAGYIAGHAPSPDSPPLFGGEPPLFYTLSAERNTLRLPAYARVDVRADRTFTWAQRRVTLFAEIANALNRSNMRNVPYGVNVLGRVSGPLDTMLPLVPSAGLLIEF